MFWCDKLVPIVGKQMYPLIEKKKKRRGQFYDTAKDCLYEICCVSEFLKEHGS